ncbi:S-methyl-5-thioribose kinase [Candidatus Poribacteria bacterium]|nr:S-methyl-5-thioribose kinase [Candidatus Poribacteria bacterium]MYH80018.1 S-methyl-5-thioribose kinase [Candidatus Poribacteria bacterium]MYK96887.1 S-methyl-5-thioribose kinase [Candidatus Poribacteria bacterium]
MELNLTTLPDYLRQRHAEIRVFAPEAELRIEEIGDGNLNTVYRVSDAARPERSLVLKHAPPYIKILGPDYPLSTERLTFESRALDVYNRLAIGTVPVQYDFDVDAAVIAMEDLRNASVLRDALIAGTVDPAIAEQVGRFMGIVHSQTYVDNISNATAQHYRQQFANATMQSITADYVFTFPFTEHETNFWTPGLEPDVQHLKADTDFLRQAAHLKRIFLTAQQGVTHGDLHTGSVLVQDNTAKVIDAEFAFYGPVGFDLGLYWANHFLSYFSHQGNLSVQSALKTAVAQVWDTYTAAFTIADAGLKSEMLGNIFQDAVGFAGLEMLRRLIGAAHVKDIEGIVDLSRKLSVERAALQFGITLVKQYPSVPDVAAIIAMLS